MPYGYSLRTWQDGDAEAYIRLMNSAGFETWGHERLAMVLKMCIPQGLFFAVHDKTGEIAGTAAALHNPIALHPLGGELGWVAVAPHHRGHNLGYAVCAAATRRLLDAGYSDIFLRTDDFRLAAIRVYLRLGYIPFLHGPDMAGRWQAVCEALGVPWPSVRRTGPLAR